LNNQLLTELWSSTLLVAQIGRKLGCSEDSVRRKAKVLGLPRRKCGSRGSNHPRWRGGLKIDKHGYILYHIGLNKYGRLHRLIMENHLGRPLLKTEVVHHVNGNIQDNQIENLKLFSKNSDHLKESLSGKVPRWTKEGRQRTMEGLRFYWKKQKSIRQEKVKNAQKLHAKNRQRDTSGRFLSQIQMNQSSSQIL